MNPSYTRYFRGGLMIACAFLAGLLGGNLRIRRPEIVYIRTSEIMARYKGAIKNRETLQRETAAWRDEAKALEEKAYNLSIAAHKSRDEKASEIREIRSNIETLRSKAARKEQEMLRLLTDDLDEKIKQFGNKNGYRIIIGTLQGGVILHGDASMDVTEPLITELNR